MELRYIGGIYGGNVKPTPFLCLILKLLQIQPEKDIVVEYIRQEDFKYVRALGAVYLRITANAVEVYKYLEPLYNDYRKLRYMNRNGEFEIIHMDELIDKLLREDRVCDVQMPRLQKRVVLEEGGSLEPRVSVLEEDLENVESSSDEEDERKTSAGNKREKKSPERKRSRSPPRRHRSRSRERYPERRRSRSRERKERPSDKSHRERGAGGTGGSRGGDSRKDRKRGRDDSYEREIKEANELRARLGMNPLQ